MPKAITVLRALYAKADMAPGFSIKKGGGNTLPPLGHHVRMFSAAKGQDFAWLCRKPAHHALSQR